MEILHILFMGFFFLMQTMHNIYKHAYILYLYAFMAYVCVVSLQAVLLPKSGGDKFVVKRRLHGSFDRNMTYGAQCPNFG